MVTLAASLLKPKSARQMLPSNSSKTLCGFKSLKNDEMEEELVSRQGNRRGRIRNKRTNNVNK
jgi:hypothetical protein